MPEIFHVQDACDALTRDLLPRTLSPEGQAMLRDNVPLIYLAELYPINFYAAQQAMVYQIRQHVGGSGAKAVELMDRMQNAIVTAGLSYAETAALFEDFTSRGFAAISVESVWAALLTQHVSHRHKSTHEAFRMLLVVLAISLYGEDDAFRAAHADSLEKVLRAWAMTFKLVTPSATAI